MNIESYDIDCCNDTKEYSFESTGPKDSVKKKVCFVQSKINGFFYLTYGDYDIESGSINENSVTNNYDTQKIINTVAKVVFIFLQSHPKCFVQFSWRDKVRRRLFTSWIARNGSLLDKYFVIYGERHNERWERYCKNVRYTAIFVKIKVDKLSNKSNSTV
jgi:hypothetical protein